ncbi:MAG: endopeptidase La [Bacilli bacterium]|nr:endopeptidase La [Bacilli bacterium]
MTKPKLPVLLLRGIVFLPYAEIKLELIREIDKRAIEIAEKYHDGHVLVSFQLDPLEESPDVSELLDVGIVSKIKMKMKLVNNKERIILKGLNRAKIYNYLEENGYFSATIGPVEQYAVSSNEELAYVRKLIKELHSYVSGANYMSNAVLSQIQGVTNASRLSDIVAFHMPIPIERKLDYVTTLNPIDRVELILIDIKQEEEIAALERKIDSELKNQLDDAQKEFILREKIRIIKEELGDISAKDSDIDQIREKIGNLKLPNKVKLKLLDEVKKYESLPPNSPEIGVVRNYIDWLLNIPWGIYTKDNNDLKRARSVLDNTHYGLEDAKTRIIEFLAVKQMTRDIRSPIICFVGPPGTGKTSLAKSIAKSLNRKFVKISVGGINDEAEIVGHRRTYIGASPGRIIQGMKRAKVSNPVFLIDELDKMTSGIKGDPASSLLEVLDPEQNSYFSDHYIEEEYDLSKVMFIATANYLYEIPEALRDRLEIIELTGYTEYEKLDIAKRHLIPRQLKEHGLGKEQVVLDDETILTIIRNYTKEAGVRELERSIATILRKIVTKLITNNSKNSKEIIKIKLSDIEEYLGKQKYFYTKNDLEARVGIVNGLAYTSTGGDILPIEVTFYKGKGNLVLTGSLGDIMKESASIALSYIKTHASEFNIDYSLIEENDIHIHVPEGAIRKDGPSAGVTLTTALISAFTNKAVKHTIGMTGEMTLRGNVLPIGGLKEKVIGAHRSGLKTILIPKDNERDLDEIPKEVLKDLEFICIDKYKDILEVVINNN